MNQRPRTIGEVKAELTRADWLCGALEICEQLDYACDHAPGKAKVAALLEVLDLVKRLRRA